MRFFCFLKHIRLFRCVAQQCWFIGKLIFRAKKRLAGRQPYDHIWSYIAIGSYAEGDLRSQGTQGYTLSGRQSSRAGRKRRAARGRAFEAKPAALEECVLSDKAATTIATTIAAIVVNSAAITRTMTTTRHCHPHSVKEGAWEACGTNICKSAFHEERFFVCGNYGARLFADRPAMQSWTECI